ncbi:unnamed protein product [Tenebrio molitor]|nr:unnamed protein product [Tenebrio molitor]
MSILVVRTLIGHIKSGMMRQLRFSSVIQGPPNKMDDEDIEIDPYASLSKELKKIIILQGEITKLKYSIELDSAKHNNELDLIKRQHLCEIDKLKYQHALEMQKMEESYKNWEKIKHIFEPMKGL